MDAAFERAIANAGEALASPARLVESISDAGASQIEVGAFPTGLTANRAFRFFRHQFTTPASLMCYSLAGSVTAMKRDMDLVRQILFEVERHPYDRDSFELVMPEHSAAEVGYHVMLLHQAHLIVAENQSYEQTSDASGWRPVALTWSGHEFLSAAENDGTWNKAKSLIASKGSGMAFEILKALLIEIGKRATFAAI